MDRYEDGSDLITGSVEQIESLFEAGADIVAVDATKRKRPDGRDGFIFFEQVRRQVSRPLMADVSTFREGVRAAEIGADVVATTLAGYTPGTATQDYRTPDFELLEELALSLTIPVIAEGRIWTPDDAARCLARGAWAAVVGTAITRPRIITQMFVDALARQTEAGEI
jgi:N-acylglucosamine-6-phosphate 2-epimerase